MKKLLTLKFLCFPVGDGVNTEADRPLFLLFVSTIEMEVLYFEALASGAPREPILSFEKVL